VGESEASPAVSKGIFLKDPGAAIMAVEPLSQLDALLRNIPPAPSLEALLVVLDHRLRGTGLKAEAAGEVLTPFGLLRGAVVVRGEEKGYLLVRTESREASRAVIELLPRALLGSPLENLVPLPVGPEPGGEPRLSLVLDVKAPGATLSPPALKGEYAMWWGKGEVFPYTRAAEVWTRWFRTLAGREEEGFFELLGLLGVPLEGVDRTQGVPGGLIFPLTLPSGARAILTYRKDRGPRLHFRRKAPAWEAEALVLNLLRTLRKNLPPALVRESEPLRWWQGVLRRSAEGLTEAVGRVRV
jgi:hypothetical protein